MKNFQIDVDITVSKRFCVSAKDEESAKNLVKGVMSKEPDYHARNFDAFIGYEIIDINEE